MKKEYIAPSIDVTEIEKTSILAASGNIGVAEEDYTDDLGSVNSKEQYWNMDYFN